MTTVNDKSFVVVKHTYFESSGTPESELVRFLGGNASSILYIRHPFPDAKRIPLNSTIVEYGPDGKIKSETTAPKVPGGSIISYVKDILFSVYYVIKSGRRFDLYVGADNLNTFAGILLRNLGRVRTVTYYVIDFTPVRFKNSLLNIIYQSINKFCCYHADYIWNVSDAMIEGREGIGISQKRSAPQLTVPLGCVYDDIPKHNYDAINPFHIVYFGMLREEHGPGLVIEALPEILKTAPDVRVIIAGDGELRSTLKKRSDECGVAEQVEFTGFVETDEDVYRLLSKCGIALATYPSSGTTYKMYSDPGKVKIYLACGLPVLITDVPPIAKEICKYAAGLVVEYNPSSLAKAVLGIITDAKRHSEMREKALEMAAKYNWEDIWKRTFDAMEF